MVTTNRVTWVSIPASACAVCMHCARSAHEVHTQCKNLALAPKSSAYRVDQDLSFGAQDWFHVLRKPPVTPVLQHDASALEPMGSGGGTDADVAVGAMLLGGTAFQLCIFYLVHHPNKSVVRNSWHTISHTISIFCGVLMYHSIHGLREYYMVVGPWESIFWDFFFLFIWFLILQVGLWSSVGLLVYFGIP